MVKSAIFSAIEVNYVSKWLDEIIQEDEFGCFANFNKIDGEFKSFLDEEGKNLLKRYNLALENHLHLAYFSLMPKILHLGIKMGMDLQYYLSEDFLGLLSV